MRFISSFFKGFFAIFGVAFITRTDLILEKQRLIGELDASYEAANKHLFEVEVYNEKVTTAKRRRTLDRYIADEPMLIKGKLSQINDILKRHGFKEGGGDIALEG